MKNKEGHQLDRMIENYLKNKGPANERHLLDKFAADSFKKQDWDGEQMGDKTAIVSEIWHKISRHQIENRRKTIRSRQIRTGIAIAASLILIFGVSFWMQRPDRKIQLFSMETGSKIDSLKLPDGSVLFLSPDTKICYNNRFNRKARNVELVKGNAFFKVTRNPQKPFIITSGAIKTKVLGTSFNIHMGTDGYRVTVHSGKVNVASASESVNLVPLQEAGYSLSNGRLSVNRVSREAISPWYNHDITLTGQNLKTILDLVEKKFGMEAVRVDPGLLSLQATVFIAREATLESVLQQISYITNLKMEAHGKEIICQD